MVNTSIRTLTEPTGHDVAVIFHVADRSRWEQSVATGMHTASSRGMELADEGFIHLCTAEQLAGVAERYYHGVPDLVLLHVDEQRLGAPLVYEQLGAATEAFPHLYGPLEVDAVVAVEPFTA
jgi:uncharacterized protein (DUF952 family)